MGYWTEQRILNIGNSNIQKTPKVMIHVFSDQGNANQNNFNIQSYTCQNS